MSIILIRCKAGGMVFGTARCRAAHSRRIAAHSHFLAFSGKCNHLHTLLCTSHFCYVHATSGYYIHFWYLHTTSAYFCYVHPTTMHIPLLLCTSHFWVVGVCASTLHHHWSAHSCSCVLSWFGTKMVPPRIVKGWTAHSEKIAAHSFRWSKTAADPVIWARDYICIGYT